MGYYNYFRLGTVDTTDFTIIRGERKHALIQALYDDQDMNPHGEVQLALDLDGNRNDESKWYDAIQQISKLSKNHPLILFILGQQACAPESPEEANEVFTGIRNGIVFSTSEPKFMKMTPQQNSQ